MSYYALENGTAVIGEVCSVLCFECGYPEKPDGCPDRGSSGEARVRSPGDAPGSISVIYADGVGESYPLVIGYTVRYKSMWERDCAPFNGKRPFADGGKLIINGKEVNGASEKRGGSYRIKAEPPCSEFEIK